MYSSIIAPERITEPGFTASRSEYNATLAPRRDNPYAMVDRILDRLGNQAFGPAIFVRFVV